MQRWDPIKPQADGEIHQDPLLNFLVNTLSGAFGLTLGENADLDLEDIYEVLIGAATDGTSISILYERANDASPSTDIFSHLRTKFNLETVKTVGNTLLRKYTHDVLPSRWRLSLISTCDPPTATQTTQTTSTTAKQNENKEPLCFMPTRHSSLACATNATPWRCAVTDGDTASSVLAEFLGVVDSFDLDLKALYVDHNFYDGK